MGFETIRSYRDSGEGAPDTKVVVKEESIEIEFPQRRGKCEINRDGSIKVPEGAAAFTNSKGEAWWTYDPKKEEEELWPLH